MRNIKHKNKLQQKNKKEYCNLSNLCEYFNKFDLLRLQKKETYKR